MSRLNIHFFILPALFVMLSPAHKAQAGRPLGIDVTGIVQSIDQQTRWITLAPDRGAIRHFLYADRASFWLEGHKSPPTAIKPGMRVKVRLHNPVIGEDFTTQIVQLAQGPSSK